MIQHAADESSDTSEDNDDKLVDIFMYAVDKSSDILENILEEAGATLGTGNLGSGRNNTHYPSEGPHPGCDASLGNKRHFSYDLIHALDIGMS